MLHSLAVPSAASDLALENKRIKEVIFECNQSMKTACDILIALKRSHATERTEFHLRYTQARAVVSHLRQQNAEKEQQLKLALQTHADEVKNLRALVQSLTEELQTKKDSEARLNEKLTNSEATVETLQREAVSRQNDLQISSENLAYLRSKFDELLDVCEVMKAERDGIQLQINSIMAEKLSLQQQIDRVMAEKLSVDDELADCKERIKKFSCKVNDYHSQVQMLQIQADGYRDDYVSIYKAHEELKMKYDNLLRAKRQMNNFSRSNSTESKSTVSSEMGSTPSVPRVNSNGAIEEETVMKDFASDGSHNWTTQLRPRESQFCLQCRHVFPDEASFKYHFNTCTPHSGYS